MDDKYIYVLTGLIVISLAINAAFIYGLFMVKGIAVDSLKDTEEQLSSVQNKKLTFSHTVDKTVTVPIDTTSKVSFSTTETVQINLEENVPIKENVHTTVTIGGQEKEIVVPIDTTTTVNIQDEVEVPIEVSENIKISKDVRVPLEMEIKIEKSLEELSIGDLVVTLQEKIRNLRKKIQNTP